MKLSCSNRLCRSPRYQICLKVPNSVTRKYHSEGDVSTCSHSEGGSYRFSAVAKNCAPETTRGSIAIEAFHQCFETGNKHKKQFSAGPTSVEQRWLKPTSYTFKWFNSTNPSVLFVCDLYLGYNILDNFYFSVK